MGAWWWSWLLALLGCAALYLIGRKDKRGWILGVAVQLLWMTYAVVTRQYGFIVASVVYGATYGKGLLAWNKEARDGSSAPATLRLIDVVLRNPDRDDTCKVDAISSAMARYSRDHS